MDFSGSADVAAARAPVWSLLLDVERLASCAPDLESVTRLDDRRARLTARSKLGFLTVRTTIDLELVEVEEPDRLVLRAHASGAGNDADAVAELRLSGVDAGPTHVDWTAQLTLSGMAATLGSGMVQGAVPRAVDQALACIRSLLGVAA